MLGEAQLDSLDAQVRSFRALDGQHYETLQDVLRKYASLVEDYRTLKSDYEEEKESREKYKRQARGLQDRNPFVLLLVDGDGYVFKDPLVKNNREGGVSAAQLLTTEIRDRLRKLGHLDHCRLIVRIYSNVQAISKALGRDGLCGHDARAIMPLVAAFNGAKESFDFVDVGENGSVVAKVEDTFRLFVDSNQCKHIFFAGCHDTSYIPLLTAHIGKIDKVTLVKAASHRPEFHSLGLVSEDFASVFRETPLQAWSPVTAKGAAAKKAPPAPAPAPVEEANGFARFNGANGSNSIGASSATNSVTGDGNENGFKKQVCTFLQQKGFCKYGARCKFEHPKTAGDAPEPRKPKQGKDFSSDWQSDNNAFADDWGNNTKAKTPSFADDWGTASRKSQSFADDRSNGPKKPQSLFADDWGNGPKKTQSSFADDGGNGSRPSNRSGPASERTNWRSQKSASISESSVGSRIEERTKPHPAAVLRSRWAMDSPESPKESESPQGEHPLLPRKFSSAFTTAADLPRPSAETEGLIPVNKYGDRLDYYLPRPTAEQYAAYYAMAKEPGRKPCNSYQLQGHCPSLATGMDCEYDHNPLSPDLFHVLRVVVQGSPCPKQGKCRRSDCYRGHVCQRPGCQGRVPCKFKSDYRAHNLDPKVADWAPAVDLEDRDDDASSVTMGSAVPEPKMNPSVPDFNPETEAEEWNPDAAAWKSRAADWKRNPAGDWNPAASEWKPTAVDRSDIDSDSDSVAPVAENEVLDLGAEDAMADDGHGNARNDSVQHELPVRAEAKPNEGSDVQTSDDLVSPKGDAGGSKPAFADDWGTGDNDSKPAAAAANHDDGDASPAALW